MTVTLGAARRPVLLDSWPVGWLVSPRTTPSRRQVDQDAGADAHAEAGRPGWRHLEEGRQRH